MPPKAAPPPVNIGSQQVYVRPNAHSAPHTHLCTQVTAYFAVRYGKEQRKNLNANCPCPVLLDHLRLACEVPSEVEKIDLATEDGRAQAVRCAHATHARRTRVRGRTNTRTRARMRECMPTHARAHARMHARAHWMAAHPWRPCLTLRFDALDSYSVKKMKLGEATSQYATVCPYVLRACERACVCL